MCAIELMEHELKIINMLFEDSYIAYTFIIFVFLQLQLRYIKHYRVCPSQYGKSLSKITYYSRRLGCINNSLFSIRIFLRKLYCFRPKMAETFFNWAQK